MQPSLVLEIPCAHSCKCSPPFSSLLPTTPNNNSPQQVFVIGSRSNYVTLSTIQILLFCTFPYFPSSGNDLAHTDASVFLPSYSSLLSAALYPLQQLQLLTTLPCAHNLTMFFHRLSPIVYSFINLSLIFNLPIDLHNSCKLTSSPCFIVLRPSWLSYPYFPLSLSSFLLYHTL